MERDFGNSVRLGRSPGPIPEANLRWTTETTRQAAVTGSRVVPAPRLHPGRRRPTA